MKMVLIGKDLWEIVEGIETLEEEASEAQKKAFKRRDNKALSTICLPINSS